MRRGGVRRVAEDVRPVDPPSDADWRHAASRGVPPRLEYSLEAVSRVRRREGPGVGQAPGLCRGDVERSRGVRAPDASSAAQASGGSLACATLTLRPPRDCTWQRDSAQWSLRCLIVTGGHTGSSDYEYTSDPVCLCTARTRPALRTQVTGDDVPRAANAAGVSKALAHVAGLVP